MATLHWGDSDEPLGEIEGYAFRPYKPADPREPITVPKEINVSLEVTLTIPDDSPVWRSPWCLAANARNN